MDAIPLTHDTLSALHPVLAVRIAAEVPKEVTSHNLPQIERELQGNEPTG